MVEREVRLRSFTHLDEAHRLLVESIRPRLILQVMNAQKADKIPLFCDFEMRHQVIGNRTCNTGDVGVKIVTKVWAKALPPHTFRCWFS